MAWNEPGGNSNNQDPWGGPPKKPGNQPPDLNELINRFLSQISGLLGGGKNNNRMSQPSKGSYAMILGVAVSIFLVLWLFKAVFVLDAQEQAIILRLGKYHETLGEGLHMYFPPLDKKFVENVTRERSYSATTSMLTKDENIVDIPFTIQYRISNVQDFILKIDDPELSLRQATDSALRHVAGSTTMDQVITEGREQMAQEVQKRLQAYLDFYNAGISVTQVNIQRATAPAEVRDAFDDVSRAREDELRAKNQADAYANAILPQARGLASRITEDATAYRDELIARAQGDAIYFDQVLVEYQKAPAVMRERMYLDAMQSVLKNTQKVLVSSNPGQTNLINLPLSPAPTTSVVNSLNPSSDKQSADGHRIDSTALKTAPISSLDSANENLRQRESR